jgi:hypothetical protein
MEDFKDFKNAVDVVTEEKKGCQSCKQSSGKSTWIMLTVSFYVLFSSIYGTIKLIKELISLF